MISSHVMVVLIVTIVMVASVMRARYKAMTPAEGAEGADAMRMRDEIKALKERVAVLERIATDKNHLLEHEFEKLRNS